MERLVQLWDEIDDLLWTARHLLRKARHRWLDRGPRAASLDAPPVAPVRAPADPRPASA